MGYEKIEVYVTSREQWVSPNLASCEENLATTIKEVCVTLKEELLRHSNVDSPIFKFGIHNSKVMVYLYRPETDEEFSTRVNHLEKVRKKAEESRAKRAAAQAKRKETLRKQEREKLEELAKKHGATLHFYTTEPT